MEKNVKKDLENNLHHSTSKLDDLKKDNLPFDLLEKALHSLENIDKKSEAFHDDSKEILPLIKSINKISFEFKELGE